MDFGLGLIFIGLVLFFPGLPVIALLGNEVLPQSGVRILVSLAMILLWCLPIIGLAYRAVIRGRSLGWAAAGWFPVLGPLLALFSMSIDGRMARAAWPNIIRVACVLCVAVALPVAVLATVVPEYRVYNMELRQRTAKVSLLLLYEAQKRHQQKHQRFGSFDEFHFVHWSPNVYTYRIKGSGSRGSVIPSINGPVTPDNAVVRAGIGLDPASFTITATANLDSDPTLDQWHISDSRPRPIHDVDDRRL